MSIYCHLHTEATGTIICKPHYLFARFSFSQVAGLEIFSKGKKDIRLHLNPPPPGPQ